MGMRKLLRDIYQRRELLGILVVRNLKIRYKNSALGFFWSLLTPLCFIVIYATFASILRFNDGKPAYLQFLIVGIVCWQFLAMCLGDSLGAIMGNVNLVKKTSFPRIILPVSTVVANLVNFLLTLVVLAGYLLISRASLGHLEWLPLIVLTQAALCLGMACIISTGNVFFRDTEHILTVATLAWFFMTPIFYYPQLQFDKLSKLPGQAIWPAFLNPMTGIITAYRSVLMGRPNPGMGLTAISFGVAWIILAIGLVVFQRSQHRFADEL